MPQPTRPEDTPPAGPPDAGEPQWASDLKQLIVELPGKLRATISDDDRNSIADRVHGLFERSGAFERPPADESTDEPEEPAEPTVDTPPASPDSERDSIARRLFGRY